MDLFEYQGKQFFASFDIPVSKGEAVTTVEDALAAKTKTNVGLGVQEDLSVFYLEYALGEDNPNRLQRAGFRVPVVRTAMGRACIAGMRPEARERLDAQVKWRDIFYRL